MSILDGIRIVTDPGMAPGTFRLHPGTCDWRAGRPEVPHAQTAWRVTIACVHEHVTDVYLCATCHDEAVSPDVELYCVKCFQAGSGRGHDCPVSLVEAVLLGDEP